MREPYGDRAAADNRGLTDLIKELRNEAIVLFRQEVELAKTEASEKAARAVRNSGSIVAGGMLAYTGALFILLAATAGVFVLLSGVANMDPDISLWLAPLIVGAVVALIGYGMYKKGVTTLKHMSPVPKKTVDSLREDKEFLSHKLKGH